MKQKRYKWIALVTIVVAVGGGWTVWQRSKEPRYEGKTVRQWIATAKGSESAGTNSQGRFMTIKGQKGFPSISAQKELQRMLDALGTNAAPVLIQILDEGDSLMTDLKGMIARSKWVMDSIKSAASSSLADSFETMMIASYAIRYLGSNAFHVIPDLERIICDSGKPSAAGVSTRPLISFGIQSLPALRRSLTNAPVSRQQMVRSAILNVLSEALQSDDARVREDAALALIEYPRAPFQIIQVFLDMLKDPDPRRQKQSLDALATHLPTMAPSLIVGYRAVEKLTNSEDAEIRRIASELLRKLPEPDPSKKP